MDPDNHLDTCHVIGYADKFVMPVPMKLIVSILQNPYKLGQYELLLIQDTEQGLEGSGSKTFRIRTYEAVDSPMHQSN